MASGGTAQESTQEQYSDPGQLENLGKRLDDSHLTVWWTLVPGQGAIVSQARTLLSTEELQRADRFKVEAPRRCFIIARSMLRSLLSRYTGLAPHNLEFCFGEKGKPELANPLERPLHFNVTHSRTCVAIAFCRDAPLGLDVEFLRPMKRAEQLAQRFFSEHEYRSLIEQPETARDAAFFHLWTGKEAYLKAIGTGLSTPLREVELNDFGDGDPRIVAIGGSRQAARQWTVYRPLLLDGIMCTAAIKGCAPKITVSRFAKPQRGESGRRTH